MKIELPEELATGKLQTMIKDNVLIVVVKLPEEAKMSSTGKTANFVYGSRKNLAYQGEANSLSLRFGYKVGKPEAQDIFGQWA